jgi:hypothetical protein
MLTRRRSSKSLLFALLSEAPGRGLLPQLYHDEAAVDVEGEIVGGVSR